MNSSDEVRWLVNDVLDSIDAGGVGLYEFIWSLRSKYPAESARYQGIATAALTQLLETGDFELVQSKWPNIRVRTLEWSAYNERWWCDPDSDGLYMLIQKKQSTVP